MENLQKKEIEKAIQEWALNYEPHPVSKHPSKPEDVGKALKSIRDGHLYRGKYANFYMYCARRWGMTPSEADRHISLSEGIQPQGVETKRKDANKSGRFVYFIEGAGLIKIGVADDVDRRFNSIKTMSPLPLTLIGYMPGDITIEAKLHGRFSEYRRHGEWFVDCKEIRDYLAEVLS